MSFINYISIITIPFTIFFIISYGLSEKINVFDTFIEGCKEGISTVVKIFPTLISFFLAINALRNSGIFDLLANILSSILLFFSIPTEILPLILIRPISGSGATAVALDIMKCHGVDSTLRNDYILYNRIYRNNFIYNCNLHSFSKNKKNKICALCCTNCRCSRHALFNNFMSNYVVKFFLTLVYFCYIMFV